MADLLLFLVVEKHLFAVLTLLFPMLPLLPLLLVLALERLVASKHAFSRMGLVLFRVVYVASVLGASYVTFVLALILWD